MSSDIHKLTGALDGGQEPCKYILDGCKVLTKRLEVWMKAKDQTVSCICF